MKETNIDSMKYRKSTHLAGIDVEAMELPIVTIKLAYYETGVNVSGNKTDGYFLDFEENIKSMLVNSTNRQVISRYLKASGMSGLDSRNLQNWVGLKLVLWFDETVKMMGQVVGGIRIKEVLIEKKISDANAIDLLNSSTSLSELQQNWQKLNKDEKKLPTVMALKENLKSKLI